MGQSAGKTATGWLGASSWEENVKLRENYPRRGEMSPYDPQFGFEKERPQHAPPVLTDDEMALASVERSKRTYCGHYWAAFYACQKENFPWVRRCKHIMSAYKVCKWEEHNFAKMEFERERRLRVREASLNRLIAREATQ